MGITETIIGSILEQLDIEQKDIDKASFTKENGRDVIIVQIGDNVQIKINR